MALPLFKFGILAVRTVSKPVANRLKSYAVDHPIMRSACEVTGQIWHRTVTRVNVRLMGHKVSKIKDLPEAEAVTRGADFFGELFVYCVSAGGIMLELWRSGREGKRKEAAKLARRAEKERVWGERLGQLDRQVAVLQEESLATRKLLEEIRQKQEAAAQKRWFSWQ